MPADLGILIVTLKRRRPYLARLMDRLGPQLSQRVEVFTLEDEGAETIGAKRQRMIEEADTPYVCFIDDDDLVAETYCVDILAKLDENPDVVGFLTNYYEDGILRGNGIITVKAKGWHSDPKRNGQLPIHWRTPNHLSPVRREMALSIGFPSKMHGEDADYSIRLFKRYPKMKEEFIEKVLYHYYYRSPKRRMEREDLAVPEIASC